MSSQTGVSSSVGSAAPLLELVRCLECRSSVLAEPGAGVRCSGCGTRHPVRGGTLRALRGAQDGDPGERAVKQQTAESFAYEWERFGALRAEWAKNFRDYLRPLGEDWFAGKRVLDVGTGSGRHSARAAELGAHVVAVDLGDSIDVARANLPEDVLTVQADAEDLPLAEGAFDLVMSIGVLHHLPDTERALRSLVKYVRPGGHLHVYLYWWPETGWHRPVLRGVERLRRVTVRLPHPMLHALCYPLAAALFAGAVMPYRHLRNRPKGRPLVERLPLKTYADYPFGVCVNDQFDRLSAPLERRFEAAEVREMLERAGLAGVQVLPNHGWLGHGTRPEGP